MFAVLLNAPRGRGACLSRPITLYLTSYFFFRVTFAALLLGPLQTASHVQNTNLTQLRHLSSGRGSRAKYTDRMCDSLPCLHSVVQCTLQFTLNVWKIFLSSRTTPVECCYIELVHSSRSWYSKEETLCKSSKLLSCHTPLCSSFEASVALV